jgi:hypothetical protein
MRKDSLSMGLLFLLAGLLACGAPAEAQKSKTSASKSSLPSVDEILEKSLYATGGREAWLKLTALHLKGQVTVGDPGMAGKLEIFAKAPDMESFCLTLTGGIFFCRGYDGQTGWTDDSQNGLKSLEGKELEEFRLEADFYSELDRRKKYSGLKVKGEGVFDGLNVYILQGLRKDGQKQELYFAKETGFEAGSKIVAESESESKTNYYGDYQEIAGPGVKLPVKLRSVSSKATVRIIVEEIMPNADIADAIFTKPRKSARDPEGAGSEERPDNGRVVDGVYTNDFFAFRYTLPQGWTVHGAETQKVLNDTGKDMLAGDDQAKRTAIESASKRSVNLLTVMEFPLGTPDKPNRGVLILADKVSFAPGIRTGKDFLLVMNKELQQSQLHVQFDGDPGEEVLTGTRFYREDIHFAVGAVTVHEVIFCSLLKGYALSIIFSAQSKERVDQVVTSLESFARLPIVSPNP